MRILGLDPGVAIVGFGIIGINNGNMHAISYGAIRTPPHDAMEQRLLTISNNISEILSIHQPDVCAIEALFFSKNVKTAMQVSQARGVLLCNLAQKNIPIYDYSPTTIKQCLIGHGMAEKKQVQFMTKELLNLKKVPSPDDVADALAVAICHHHSVQFK